MGNFGNVKNEDLFGKKTWIFEIPCECKILLPLGKIPRSSLAILGTSLKSVINSGLDSYSSHAKDIVGEAYVFIIFYPLLKNLIFL